ncbi:MAG: hypothetical protein ACR2HX_18435 [Pyrinomonadaceae bacterium]
MESVSDKLVFPTDPILQAVVSLVSSHDEFTCDVSFTFNGLVIEGTLISERQYLLNYTKQTESVDAYRVANAAALNKAGLNNRDELEEAVNSFKNAVKQMHDKSRSVSGTDSSYIHLRQVKIVQANSQAKPVDFWRGRINAIDSIIHIGQIRAGQ